MRRWSLGGVRLEVGVRVFVVVGVPVRDMVRLAVGVSLAVTEADEEAVPLPAGQCAERCWNKI